MKALLRALAWLEDAFLVLLLLLMIGVSLIVYPQWRHNERLPFPLLTVYDSLIEPPGARGCFSPVFRQRIFWLGAIVVFVLHLTGSGRTYLAGRVPVPAAAPPAASEAPGNFFAETPTATEGTAEPPVEETPSPEADVPEDEGEEEAGEPAEEGLSEDEMEVPGEGGIEEDTATTPTPADTAVPETQGSATHGEEEDPGIQVIPVEDEGVPSHE